MITDESITDAQLHKLKVWVLDRLLTPSSYDEALDCDVALYHTRVALGERVARRGGSRAQSSARCAEILNARAAKETK